MILSRLYNALVSACSYLVLPDEPRCGEFTPIQCFQSRRHWLQCQCPLKPLSLSLSLFHRYFPRTSRFHRARTLWTHQVGSSLLDVTSSCPKGAEKRTHTRPFLEEATGKRARLAQKFLLGFWKNPVKPRHAEGGVPGRPSSLWQTGPDRSA